MLRTAGHGCPLPNRAPSRLRLLSLVLMLVLAVLPVAARAAAGSPVLPTTLGEALKAVMDAGSSRLVALEDQAKAASGEAQALAVQEQAIEAKAEIRRRLFEVQLDFARRANNANLVQELESILAGLDAPVPGTPQERPVPSNATEAR